MSAFMMSAESLAKIAAHIHRSAQGYRPEHIETILKACRDYEAKHNKVVSIGETSQETIFRVLELMNAESLRERYGDELESNISETVPAFPFWRGLNDVELFKLIQCYLYQCNEGHIDQTPLFKAVKMLEGALASKIVESLPQYEAAKWG